MLIVTWCAGLSSLPGLSEPIMNLPEGIRTNSIVTPFPKTMDSSFGGSHSAGFSTGGRAVVQPRSPLATMSMSQIHHGYFASVSPRVFIRAHSRDSRLVLEHDL